MKKLIAPALMALSLTAPAQAMDLTELTDAEREARAKQKAHDNYLYSLRCQNGIEWKKPNSPAPSLADARAVAAARRRAAAAAPTSLSSAGRQRKRSGARSVGGQVRGGERPPAAHLAR